MNRKIKFRIWDEESKKYLNSRFFTIDGEGQLGMIGASIDYIPNFKNVIIQQSTGLKDKNGKTIYEGDIIIFMGKWDENGKILSPDYRPYKIIWFMGGLHAVIETLKAFPAHNECLGVGHTDSEIIGNIFENPELLNHEI